MDAVRRAVDGDVPALSRVLARAFIGDPVVEFLFPDASRRRERLPAFFALQLRAMYLPSGEVYTTVGRSGAAMWMASWAAPPDLVHRVRQLGLLAQFGRRAPAGRHLARALARCHPPVPHYYLGTVGTDPAYQHHGVASSLIWPVLARCDELGVPAYLECSLEENVGFYARFGFAVREQTGGSVGSPMLWLMQRDPVQAS